MASVWRCLTIEVFDYRGVGISKYRTIGFSPPPNTAYSLNRNVHVLILLSSYDTRFLFSMDEAPKEVIMHLRLLETHCILICQRFKTGPVGKHNPSRHYKCDL